MQAFDIIAAARAEGINDPYKLLARLMGSFPGMTGKRGREILRLEGIEISDLVDPRFEELTPRRSAAGFARNYA